jgi:hypothetical protein
MQNTALHCKFGSWAMQVELGMVLALFYVSVCSCRAYLSNAGANPARIIVFYTQRSDVNLRLVHRGIQ